MIGVTGASGYVGGRILSHLRAAGMEAIALVRSPPACVRSPEEARHSRRYALAEPLEPSLLSGVTTVVHAAYDFSPRDSEIYRVNCLGSLPLLDGVAAQGGRTVLISSLSAFEGTRSHYGRAKLALERAVSERDGAVLRPGLVFGIEAGGLFGAMVAALSRRGLAPMVGGGWQRQFLTHDAHLGELVAAIVGRQFEPEGAVFAAHEVPSTLRQIAAQIARMHERRLRVIPLPPALVYLALRGAEATGLALPFRSDSVLSLMNPIPLDQVAGLERSPVSFPPLSPELWSG
jgi:nucleoside-diphosphate-sugar epimerase